MQARALGRGQPLIDRLQVTGTGVAGDHRINLDVTGLQPQPQQRAPQAVMEVAGRYDKAEIWAGRGGFSSANQNLDSGVYPDPITETTATAIAEAEEFRFDMSDLQPSEFGSTEGQGLWKIFQDFVANPDDIDGTAQQLETAAAAAYGE